MSTIKERVIIRYKKQKEAEDRQKQAEDPEYKKKVEDFNREKEKTQFLKEKNQIKLEIKETKYESDDSLEVLSDEEKQVDPIFDKIFNEVDEIVSPIKKEKKDNAAPYLYIDFDEENTKEALKNGYKIYRVNRKKGLQKTNIWEIINNDNNFSKYHIIINAWHVLTNYSLNATSKECDLFSHKLSHEINDCLKWGSKQFLKFKMTKDEQIEHSPFVDCSRYFFKLCNRRNVKIYVISHSHYSFVKAIFKHFDYDKYIEEYFTPSVCNLPRSTIGTTDTILKDRRHINIFRIFACIEKYVGRLPKNE